MKKVSLLLLIVSALAMALLPALAQPQQKGVVWSNAETISGLMQQQPKPIVVDVYTTWCHYCKVMDATTWKNDSVAAYMEQNYYAVKLNAEDKKPVAWMGNTYEFLGRYKVNKLAVALLRGNMVYPSTVIIPTSGEWQVLPGVLKPSELEMVLKYYGSDAWQTMDFLQWQRKFSSTWKN